MTVGGITVDVCKGRCGGIWFDRFELKKFDEAHESAGEHLLEVEQDSGTTVDHTKRRKCPKCDNILMMRHFFSIKKQVEVDECPGCGGFWLDSGELGRIRSLFKNEQEKIKATEEYFSEIFDKQLAKMKHQSQEKFEKANRIANMFLLIWPNYYSPAKWKEAWRGNNATA
jgi:Zn-finger nucleic acid-binding protein